MLFCFVSCYVGWNVGFNVVVQSVRKFSVKTVMGRPLALIFKAAKEGSGDEDPYVEKLQELGIDCRVVPVLSFEFINLRELREKLANPDRYSGIIFSSPRAVEAVKLSSSDLSKWAGKLSFAVGEKTASDVIALGLRPLGYETGTSALLAEHILTHEIHSPLLLPCGNLSSSTLSDVLERNSITLDKMVVYQTVPEPHLADTTRRIVDSFVPSTYLIYFSPSGVKATIPIFEKLGVDMSLYKFGAIGPTTEAALSSHVNVSFVAEKPTPEHFAEALKKFLNNQ